MGLIPIRFATAVIAVAVLFPTIFSGADGRELYNHSFGPFNRSYYNTFQVVSPATISNDALQVTPDTANGNLVSLVNKSGRVLFKRRFKLWDGDLVRNSSSSSASGNSTAVSAARVASFNTTFDINIYRLNNDSAPGEGFAFLIAPDLEIPPGSDGGYLGLSNATTDGNASNHFVALELDTFKESFDPDDNHMGLDINGVRSVKIANLTALGIEIAPPGVKIYRLWLFYDGVARSLSVFMAERAQIRPSDPVLTADLDLSAVVNQYSYFGFAASTGTNIQLNCVLSWNLTVELLPEKNDRKPLVIGLAAGIPSALLFLAAIAAAAIYIRKKRAAGPDPNILESLKSLPGTPREFRFNDLKKATNNFDDKNRLGEGGFGVVYKGVLAKEDLAVAVKKFSRQDLKGKDDFLSELTIINRLRHKHLVRLLGWCHKNGVLLLVYDYMPNGSLDAHIFCESDNETLSWSLRYKILTGVASALHYLHNEYDQKVVHRDLKASNILLDSGFNARLGDFGLARAIDNGKTSYAELDGMPGTMGYIAPECLHTGRATRESDVYGFGAVLLEVVCGQRPWTNVDGFNCLVDWVWFLHREGRVLDAVDRRLAGDYVAEEAERVLMLGLACSHPIASERPKTEAIVQILSGSVAPPRVPPFRPAFVWPSSGNMRTSMDISQTTSSSVGSDWTPRFMSKDSYYVGQSDNSLPLV